MSYHKKKPQIYIFTIWQSSLENKAGNRIEPNTNILHLLRRIIIILQTCKLIV